MMKTRKKDDIGKELIEVEFSSATVGFWAWLLGTLLLSLEGCVEKTNKSGDQSFKGDLSRITQLCRSLHLFVNGDGHIVEALLTQTSLAMVFNLPKGDDDDNADDNDNTEDDDDGTMLLY
jgi:hypothetical protein